MILKTFAKHNKTICIAIVLVAIAILICRLAGQQKCKPTQTHAD
jgi:hypothetical protein